MTSKSAPLWSARQGRPGVVEPQHLVGDEAGVEAVGDEVRRERREQDPQRRDGSSRLSARTVQQTAPTRATATQTGDRLGRATTAGRRVLRTGSAWRASGGRGHAAPPLPSRVMAVTLRRQVRPGAGASVSRCHPRRMSRSRVAAGMFVGCAIRPASRPERGDRTCHARRSAAHPQQSWLGCADRPARCLRRRRRHDVRIHTGPSATATAGCDTASALEDSLQTLKGVDVREDGVKGLTGAVADVANDLDASRLLGVVDVAAARRPGQDGRPSTRRPARGGGRAAQRHRPPAPPALGGGGAPPAPAAGRGGAWPGPPAPGETRGGGRAGGALCFWLWAGSNRRPSTFQADARTN